MQIKIKKGLDIPLAGCATGDIVELKAPTKVAATFDFPGGASFKLLVKAGDRVQIGTPLAEHKVYKGLYLTSPGGGSIGEIRRGERRSLQAISIDIGASEESERATPLDVHSASREVLIDSFKRWGLLFYLRRRPFDQLCDPAQLPRSIFVKALESAPGSPAAELQVTGRERAFQLGLNALSAIAKVHLVHAKNSDCKCFTEAKGVEIHSAEGPHPRSSASVHIQAIDPIQSASDVVWTIDTLGVLAIGALLGEGRFELEQVVALSGLGLAPSQRGYYRARRGGSISDLLRASPGPSPAFRLIAGDPLTGTACTREDFLGFSHQALVAIPESRERQFLNFFRLGAGKFTATRTYWTGLARAFGFTTHLHGQERAFIDARPYRRVMPLDICVVELVKACLANDFQRADELGLLQVDAGDLALPTFICPSKIEIRHIIEQALVKRVQDEE